MDAHNNQEPIGFLSSVYPGLVRLQFPRPDTGPVRLSLLSPTEPRSRVCEQVWLDEELFDLAPGQMIYAIAEEDYRALAAAINAPGAAATPPPCGRMGEQLLLRDLNRESLTPGTRIRLADAVLEVNATLDAQVGTAPITIYAFNIIEPGLVEPGAHIIAILPSRPN